MKFSIGYNHDIKLLDLLDVYKNNIEALYFPMPGEYLGSGRRIPQKSSYPNEIPEIIRKCNSLNIKSQLLLNATCEGKLGVEKKFFSKIINYIQKLKSSGLKSVIVTNPVYMSEIKSRIKGIAIESSVNCYVKTVEHALYLKDLGVDVLTIDRDINRNIPLIKKIKDKTGLKIRVMLNEGCLRNCPFRNMHYNYLSHDSLSLGPDRLIDNIFPDKFCIKIYLKDPAKIFSVPFIPPEALKHYNRIADYYKLSTRTFATSRIKSCLKAYINQNFNGNLLEIIDCPGLSYFDFINYDVLKKNNFFKKIIKCNDSCTKCNYCNRLMKNAVIINSDFLKKQEKIKEGKKAIKMYKKVLKISQDKVPIYLKLSKAYLSLKEYKKAIITAKRVIDPNYKEGNMHLFLGVCYEKTRQYKKAIVELKEAEKINPKVPQISFSLSNCYRNIGQKELFNKELDKGIIKLKKFQQKIS